MRDTILFDLDGTLLPISQDAFVKVYMKQLCSRYAPLGYDSDGLVKALWTATGAMVKNDGSTKNAEVFWKIFENILGDVAPIRDTIDDFYSKEFAAVREVSAPTPLSREIVSGLKDRGYDLILATNPIFPPVAVEQRISWAGISPDDFSYITTYENSSFCKPFAGYYNEILSACGKSAEQCMMIGNSPVEDMSAAKLGIDVYLVTDCLENDSNVPIDAFTKGSLKDFKSYAESLPKVK